MNESITVETHIHAPIEKVWHDFTDPEAIKVWNAASDDWHTTQAENNVKVGGTFSYRMEAKDGSEGFYMKGKYESALENKHLVYILEDGRKVEVTFLSDENAVRLIVTFVPEKENSHEIQRSGWQAILDNFKRYVEGEDSI